MSQLWRTVKRYIKLRWSPIVKILGAVAILFGITATIEDNLNFFSRCIGMLPKVFGFFSQLSLSWKIAVLGWVLVVLVLGWFLLSWLGRSRRRTQLPHGTYLRREEDERLRELFYDQHTPIIVVSGASGVGKTLLVDALERELQADENRRPMQRHECKKSKPNLNLEWLIQTKIDLSKSRDEKNDLREILSEDDPARKIMRFVHYLQASEDPNPYVFRLEDYWTLGEAGGVQEHVTDEKVNEFLLAILYDQLETVKVIITTQVKLDFLTDKQSGDYLPGAGEIVVTSIQQIVKAKDQLLVPLNPNLQHLEGDQLQKVHQLCGNGHPWALQAFAVLSRSRFVMWSKRRVWRLYRRLPPYDKSPKEWAIAMFYNLPRGARRSALVFWLLKSLKPDAWTLFVKDYPEAGLLLQYQLVNPSKTVDGSGEGSYQMHDVMDLCCQTVMNQPLLVIEPLGIFLRAIGPLGKSLRTWLARRGERALHRSAADFLAKLYQPEAEGLQGLEPKLQEFEHRVQAGQYSEAYRALCSVDKRLVEYGQYAESNRMRRQLAGKLRPDEEALNEVELSEGLYQVDGEWRDALKQAESVEAGYENGMHRNEIAWRQAIQLQSHILFEGGELEGAMNKAMSGLPHDQNPDERQPTLEDYLEQTYVANAYNSLGVMLQSRAREEEAAGQYQEAFNLFREIEAALRSRGATRLAQDCAREAGRVQINWSATKFLSEGAPSAIQMCEEGLALCKKEERAQEFAYGTLNKAIYHSAAGDLNEAQASLDRCAHWGESWFQRNFKQAQAAVYRFQGKYQDALDLLQGVQDEIESIECENAGIWAPINVRINKGLTLSDMRNPQEARTLWREALQMALAPVEGVRSEPCYPFGAGMSGYLLRSVEGAEGVPEAAIPYVDQFEKCYLERFSMLPRRRGKRALFMVPVALLWRSKPTIELNLLVI